MPTRIRESLRTTYSFCLSILLLALCALPAHAQAPVQDGVSTAAAARTRYLAEMGLIPASRSVAVEEFVNYHRHQIGRPKASRAVGAAVGKNPISFVVPCHRVVGSTGALTGYHWGVPRKRAILGWEAGVLSAAH